MQTMKQEFVDKKIDWDKVKYFSSVDEIQRSIEKKDLEIEKRTKSEDTHKQRALANSLEIKFQNHLQQNLKQEIEQDEDDDIDQDVKVEARERFLMALKQMYWDLFS